MERSDVSRSGGFVRYREGKDVTGRFGDGATGGEPRETLGDPPERIVERLFAHHGLGPVHRVRPLLGGQINQVLEVNGEYVVRFRPPEKDGGAFATEQWLFPQLLGRAPVAEVVLVDTSRAVAPVDCAVSRRLRGDNLVRVWLTAGARQRAWYVIQLAEAMRALHEVRFPACGRFQAGNLLPAASWDAYLAERFERRLGLARGYATADMALLDAIELYWRRNRSALAERPPCLVHRDLHFGNLLVADNRITGVLDFEAALAAPCDYELDQLLRFVRYPALFVEEELEPHVGPALFAEVWSGLRRAYPELFYAAELSTRLSLYALEYDLAALRDCYAGRWDGSALRHVTERVRASLEERLLPTG
jgi:hypothetical protein